MDRPHERAVSGAAAPSLRRPVLINGHDIDTIGNAITAKISELSAAVSEGNKRIRDILLETAGVLHFENTDDAWSAYEMIEVMGIAAGSVDLPTLWEAANRSNVEDVQKILLDLKKEGFVGSDPALHRWSLTRNGKEIYGQLKSSADERGENFHRNRWYEDRITRLKAARREAREHETAEKRALMVQSELAEDIGVGGIVNSARLRVAIAIIDKVVDAANSNSGISLIDLSQAAGAAALSGKVSEESMDAVSPVFTVFESGGIIVRGADGLWAANDPASVKKLQEVLLRQTTAQTLIELDEASRIAAARVKQITGVMKEEGISVM